MKVGYSLIDELWQYPIITAYVKRCLVLSFHDSVEVVTVWGGHALIETFEGLSFTMLHFERVDCE